MKSNKIISEIVWPEKFPTDEDNNVKIIKGYLSRNKRIKENQSSQRGSEPVEITEEQPTHARPIINQDNIDNASYVTTTVNRYLDSVFKTLGIRTLNNPLLEEEQTQSLLRAMLTKKSFITFTSMLTSSAVSTLSTLNSEFTIESVRQQMLALNSTIIEFYRVHTNLSNTDMTIPLEAFVSAVFADAKVKALSISIASLSSVAFVATNILAVSEHYDFFNENKKYRKELNEKSFSAMNRAILENQNRWTNTYLPLMLSITFNTVAGLMAMAGYGAAFGEKDAINTSAGLQGGAFIVAILPTLLITLILTRNRIILGNLAKEEIKNELDIEKSNTKEKIEDIVGDIENQHPNEIATLEGKDNQVIRLHATPETPLIDKAISSATNRYRFHNQDVKHELPRNTDMSNTPMEASVYDLNKRKK